MPKEYETTIEKLQSCLSDNQIAKILHCTYPNEALLNILYEKINSREDLLDFYHQLEIIGIPQNILDKLRSGKLCTSLDIIMYYIHTY